MRLKTRSHDFRAARAAVARHEIRSPTIAVRLNSVAHNMAPKYKETQKGKKRNKNSETYHIRWFHAKTNMYRRLYCPLGREANAALMFNFVRQPMRLKTRSHEYVEFHCWNLIFSDPPPCHQGAVVNIIVMVCPH